MYLFIIAFFIELNFIIFIKNIVDMCIYYINIIIYKIILGYVKF